MNITQFMRVWLWIAIAFCILSVLATTVASHIEWNGQCPPQVLSDRRSPSIYAPAFWSAFMVFFFAWGLRRTSLEQITEVLNSEFRHFHIIHERVPLTAVHLIVHLPMTMFCVFTLAAPAFALGFLYRTAKLCGSI
jgi:hypothetical protein